MSFRVLYQDQFIMNNIKVNKNNLKKLNELIGKYPKQELFIFDESQFAYIQKLNIGSSKRTSEYRLK
ncbi:hypothetical protein GOY07_04050 [Wolbachia endosymbiont of Litomosoides sigmodontis]|uniref:hypothetical protein n=1 Tax=Wolbachia endosymbiont of Litomosoides sigmodontis TaxID=80850 RepID=UPI00158A926E|nr:hypothetical protein [Wolbachia endosymbiont of Litomosoides sigmodontis]QKX03300.1 hypothetical protein GOY07_04050 [Wolbachia endosymbiont of Litomosoides sigmodontis]